MVKMSARTKCHQINFVGDNQYTPPDDDSYTQTWPQYPDVWYLNFFLQAYCGNVIFALFTKGLLNICEKLCNPLSLADTSFSERVYGMHNKWSNVAVFWRDNAYLFVFVFVFDFDVVVSVMKNNCRALRAGFLSYRSLDVQSLESPLKHHMNKNEDRDDSEAAAIAATLWMLWGTSL